MEEILSWEDVSRELPAAVSLEQACLQNKARSDKICLENQLVMLAPVPGSGSQRLRPHSCELPQEVSAQDPKRLPLVLSHLAFCLSASSRL